MADADMQASARRASANQDAATQDAAIAFLADPASHGVAPTDLRRIDTHGAIIVLAGDRAYKMKRAVRYSFMDFSTLDLRERACRQEIALNRRTAPDIYLGLMRILRRADGRLALVEANEGDGDTIDWVVAMRRFDPDATLDRIADRHGITDALADQMAAEVIALHDGAEPLDAAAGRDEAACMIEISRDNVTTLSDRPDIADPDRVARYAEKVSATLDGNRALFAERVRQGAVRRCHGDLHLRNIALIEGWPVIFDAIEFDDALATTDWLYDLAFLLMDLWTRGEGHAANRVMNGVLAHHRDALDLDGLALLPAFLSIRAAVRSKVALLSSGVLDGDARTRKEDEARWFFDAAERFIAPETPRLVAIGGLSGSGKTTAARALCPDIEPAPGALHLRSDVERKRLAGLEETDRLPDDAYTPDAARRVYARLLDLARHALGAGHSVVLDAVHARPHERQAVRDLARDIGVPFTGLWLTAPVDTLAARADARMADQARPDASDASGAVVKIQASHDLGVMDWIAVDAAGTPADTIAQARRVLAAAKNQDIPKKPPTGR